MSLQLAKEILAEQTGCDFDEITPDADLVQDLGVDSLDAVELAMELEERFKVEINDEIAFQWTTVQKFANYIESVNKVAAPPQTTPVSDTEKGKPF